MFTQDINSTQSRQSLIGEDVRHPSAEGASLLDTQMNEIWKDVTNYEGFYQISNRGNVKNIRTGKILINQISQYGYHYISMSAGGNVKKYLVHRLVAIVFIQKDEKRKIINHKNGIRTDNRPENLEWCNHSENAIHAFSVLGVKGSATGKIGKQNPGAIRIIQMNLMGEKIKEWDCITDVERSLNISHQNIIKVCQNKRNKTGGFKWKYAN